jgi:F5/8 type C domain
MRTAIALLALLAAPVLAAEDMVPLKVDLPKPLFVGTPRPIKVSNLEPAQSGEPAPLMVPAGTVLLSKGKAVTASDMEPVIGELTCVTDGDKSGIEGSYVELGPGVQWVQVDLGAAARLSAVVVWHFHAEARVYHAVVVQVSNDPTFKTGVTTLFNNDDTNADGLGKGSDYAYIETYRGRVIDAKGVSARYVRLYSNGNTSDELNHYTEVEVYGKPAG